jgi:hypothetical protein
VRCGRGRKGRVRRYLAISSGVVFRDVPGTIADQAGRYARAYPARGRPRKESVARLTSVRDILTVLSLSRPKKCGQPGQTKLATKGAYGVRI